MMKKLFFLFLLPLCLLSAELDPASLREQLTENVVQAEIPLLVSTPRLSLISRGVVWAFERYHYVHPKMTPELLSAWYTNYFQLLDPSKIYFLQSDLEEFRGYEQMLCTKGVPNLDFAFVVYQRCLQRMREWAVYSFNAYDKPCDFSEEEYLELHDYPEDHDWPADNAEREKLWRLRVKNTLLADQLTQEDMKNVKVAETEADGTHRAVYTPPPIRLRSQKAIVTVFQNHLNVEPMEVMGYFINSLALILDPHTCYFVPRDKENFDIAMSLSLQGIGATLSTRDAYTVVVSLVPGGPAARDGRLRPGDRIVAVAQAPDQEPIDVVDMPLDKVVEKIRGQKGTSVYLTIMPEGVSTSYTLELVRDEIKLKDAEAQSKVYQVDGKRVLCIYLPSFYRDFEGYEKKDQTAKSTTVDVLHLLEEARKEGAVDGLILDMRANGGGSLDETVQLSSAFLKTTFAPIPISVVQTQDSAGAVSVLAASRNGLVYDGPLMVMVDQGAASATEILAACLQDCGRAVIVGDPGTHGKGSVQTLLDAGQNPLMRRGMALFGDKTDSGSIKITIQKFYRITGGSTQLKGVTPDICFPSFMMASRSSEADLPHALPWDEIKPAPYTTQTELAKYLPELKAAYEEYAATNPAFQQYSQVVEEYLKMRDERRIPLEIQARRNYRDKEMQMTRKIRHYQPKRNSEEQERLHDADEVLYEDGGPRQDVILDASLAIMEKMLEINDREKSKPFSLK